jgi:flagellar biosynthesis/type III secretory pathway chaperone
METIITLINLLDAEKEVFEDVCGILKNERDALIANDLKQLSLSLKQKEYTAARLKTLENERRRICDRLYKVPGVEGGEMKMASLIAMTDDPHAARLKILWDGLTTVMHRVRKMGDHNRKLLDGMLGLVKSSLVLFENMTGTSPVYRRSGKLHDHRSTGKVFCGSI